MRVAVLCEFSGVVRDAFLRRGHDAVSCDLLPTESPGPHVVGDCLKQNWTGFNLLVCHPECTRLCNSGVRWLAERDLWGDMEEACRFFNACRALGKKYKCSVALENPIPHKYARKRIGTYNQIIQPWWFGHKEMKATCLWLDRLPPLKPTNIVGPPPTNKSERRKWAVVHNESPGPDRWKKRSTTYRGVADAMAEQWGDALALLD